MGRRFTGIILIFIIILTACNHTDTQLKGQLDLIDSIIEKDGGQAYKMLKGMNRDSISSKSEYARYSLLMSMAMDKNYIDITSDSIIAPAVEYYRKHGSNDHKMKALYYRGVVERNAGNNESALEYKRRIICLRGDYIMLNTISTRIFLHTQKLWKTYLKLLNLQPLQP